MATNSNLASIDLGLGGLGDALTQQMKDSEEERKRRLGALAQSQQPKAASALGLGAVNLLGGYRG